MATSKHETRFELTATDKTKAAIKSAEGGFKQLDGLVTKLAVGFAGLAGGAGIGLLIQRQTEGARRAVAYADALQIPIDKLTAMQAAGEVVGINADKMGDILKDTSEKIADAYRNNGGEAVEVLNSLGLNIEHINSLSPDRQLLAIADALGQVGTQGEKIQIMEALASDAALLLPLLDDNAARLKDLMQQADGTGKTLQRIEADKLIEVDEAMRKMSMASDGLQQALAVTLGPELANIANWFSVYIPKAIDIGSDWFDAFRIGALQTYVDLATVFAPENNEIIKSVRATIQRLTNEILIGQAEIQRFSPAGLQIGSIGADGGGSSPELEKLRQQLLTEEEAIMESHLRRQTMINEFDAQGLQSSMSYDEMRARAFEDFEMQMTTIAEREGKKREQIEAQVQSKIAGLKGTGLNIAVGMLRQLGQEHDGAAYAAIALEKAIALAQIETSTAAALAAANTLYSLGPAGPAAVAAARADILSSAAFSRGMVIASGILEASQVGRGGGGVGGGGAIPVTPVQSPTNLAPINSISAPEQGNQITIVIKGEGPFDDMVRNSVETLSNNDELVIVRG